MSPVVILAQMLAGIAIGYLIASVAESFLHKNVQHASARVRRFWMRHPRLCTPFLRAYYSHHVIHHARTFRQDFVTQFRSEDERRKLDQQIPPHYRKRIVRERYGLTLKGLGVILFVLPIVPLAPLVYLLLGPWATAGACLPMFVVYPLMSLWLHPLLHLPHEEARRRTSRLGAWLLGTRYMKHVVSSHYMHHKYITCDYNLLLGGDVLLGVYRPPGPEDQQAMARLGLPVGGSGPPDRPLHPTPPIHTSAPPGPAPRAGRRRPEGRTNSA